MKAGSPMVSVLVLMKASTTSGEGQYYLGPGT
jgi:hypothetical protein